MAGGACSCPPPRRERQLLARQDRGRRHRPQRRWLYRLRLDRLERRGLLLGRERRRLGLRGEAEVVEQALADPGLRRQRGGRASLVGHQDLRVVGLALVARLECAFQPDRAAADLAAPRPALNGLVLVLLAVEGLVVPLVDRVAEQGPELSQPLGHLSDRRARGDEDPVGGQQAEQWRRDPGRQSLVERPGGDHPDQAARGPDRRPAAAPVRQRRHALRDVQQAQRAQHQRGPADLRLRERRVPVRVAHEPPADQPEDDRDREGAFADERARQGVNALERGVLHAGPDGGGEDDREPEEDQADAVALVIGLQVPRVAAEAADDAAHARPPAATPSRSPETARR